MEFESYYAPWDSWFHLKAYPAKDGGLSVFFHDITARKRSDEAIRRPTPTWSIASGSGPWSSSGPTRAWCGKSPGGSWFEEVRRQAVATTRPCPGGRATAGSRELHDDLTQRLAVLAIDAGMIEQLSGGPAEIATRASGMCEQLVPFRERAFAVVPDCIPRSWTTWASWTL